MEKIQNLVNSDFERWSGLMTKLDYEFPEIITDDPTLLIQLSQKKQKKREIFKQALRESLLADSTQLTAGRQIFKELHLMSVYRKFFLMLHLNGRRECLPYIFSILELMGGGASSANSNRAASGSSGLKILGYVLGSLLFGLDEGVVMMSSNVVLKDIKSGEGSLVLMGLGFLNDVGDEQMVLSLLAVLNHFLGEHYKTFEVWRFYLFFNVL